MTIHVDAKETGHSVKVRVIRASRCSGFRSSHAVTVMRQVSVVGNELLVPMAFKIGISEVDGQKGMPESAGIAGVMQLRVFDRNG